MISPLRTYFRGKGWLAVLLLLHATPAFAGSVIGSVRLIDSRDARVRKSNDYFGVTIWLERTDGAPIPIQPKTAQMAQKKKTLVPHVVAVPLGSTVSFP